MNYFNQDDFVMLPHDDGYNFRIFGTVSINIVEVPQNGVWKIKAAIGYDFLSGGSLG